MRTCETCRWYIQSPSAEYDKCGNQKIRAIERKTSILSLVRANTLATIFCEYARTYQGECEPDGRFWEKADVPF